MFMWETDATEEPGNQKVAGSSPVVAGILELNLTFVYTFLICSVILSWE